ncbi:hypothetical protein RND81_12G139000 [Saponaria officinalis]|uniref:Trichome birefringence-like N-terminal domain-containing protein n=1 Tax=Saponaria officinalis TaxID=3572 RepID=A0AAW1HAD8_SAPOF
MSITNTTMYMSQTLHNNARNLLIFVIFIFIFAFILSLNSTRFESGPSPVIRIENGSSNLISATRCDLLDGSWVYDEHDPAYESGSCPFISDSFNCFKNGRRDFGYLKYRWQPYGCDIPRYLF